jgi:hypothetical protein
MLDKPALEFGKLALVRKRPTEMLHAPYVLGNLCVGHDNLDRSRTAEAGDPHNKPALLLRTVARVFRVKFTALSSHDLTDAAGHRRCSFGEIADSRLADLQVIFAHAVPLASIVILDGKAIPWRVDSEDCTVLIENCDVGSEGVECGLQEAIRGE